MAERLSGRNPPLQTPAGTGSSRIGDPPGCGRRSHRPTKAQRMMTEPREARLSIMVIDHMEENHRLFVGSLRSNGYDVVPFTRGDLALKAAETRPPDLVLLDTNVPGLDGYEVCKRLKEDDKLKGIPVIFLTASEEEASKVRAFDVGAADYIAKPFHVQDVLRRVKTHMDLKLARDTLKRKNVVLDEQVQDKTQELENALAELVRLKERVEAENAYLREEFQKEFLHGDIVGVGEAMKSVLDQIKQVAETDATVLILGETGAGKEMVARGVHNNSPRRERPLVVISCAAMPSTLVESELFGCERGAYTGALTRRTGRFELADKSTIFLDEIGELSPEVQVKLLRVLQEGQFERLGGNAITSVDVRIIAATSKDLTSEIRSGKFREDLFYRLNVFPIRVPPLREHREDIPLLVWYFIKELSTKMRKSIMSIPLVTMDALQRYSWPGNVRELKNVIERALILSEGHTLRVEMPSAREGLAPASMTLDDVQRKQIIDVLELTAWRVRGNGGAAQLLGLKPSTLESRMAKLGVKRPKLGPDRRALSIDHPDR